jgi:predicted Fe-Mo cluster-binding NifX family protein
MKIAIPLFGSRVSPRFGCESEILIVDIEQGKEINRRTFSTIGLGISHQISLLSSLGVDTLICGGIDIFCRRSLSARGFQLIPGVIGEADEVLKYFLSGKLRKGQCVRRGRQSCNGRRRFFSEHNRNRNSLAVKKR